MAYLNFERLEAIDPIRYRRQTPYPWVNLDGALTDAGHRALLATLPDLSMFQEFFGKQRSHGQQPHDRYVLEYEEGLDLSESWREFIAELRGDRYWRLICRMVGASAVDLRLHWHYAPRGCSVSPHCDALRKFGSHIFYFNDEKDWDPSWGGETLILDDGGRFKRGSAPAFEDFDRAIASRAVGNWSLLFTRNKNSWHGVKEIRCPEGQMRKVFVVVINRVRPMTQVLRRLRTLNG